LLIDLDEIFCATGQLYLLLKYLVFAAMIYFTDWMTFLMPNQQHQNSVELLLLLLQVTTQKVVNRFG